MKMSKMHKEKLLEEFQQVIESAYQDMQGVLWGRKNYRLRHRELAERLLVITEREILSARPSLQNDMRKYLSHLKEKT